MPSENLSPIPGIILTDGEIEKLSQYPADAIEHVRKKIHLLKDPRNPMRWIIRVCENYMQQKASRSKNSHYENTFQNKKEHTTSQELRSFEGSQGSEESPNKRKERSIFPERQERTVVGEYYRSILLQETPKFKDAAKILPSNHPALVNPFLGRMQESGLSTEVDPSIMAKLRWQEYLAHKDGNPICGCCTYNGSKQMYNDCHFFPLIKDADWVTFSYSEYSKYHLNDDHTVKDVDECVTKCINIEPQEVKALQQESAPQKDRMQSTWVQIGNVLPF